MLPNSVQIIVYSILSICIHHIYVTLSPDATVILLTCTLKHKAKVRIGKAPQIYKRIVSPAIREVVAVVDCPTVRAH